MLRNRCWQGTRPGPAGKTYMTLFQTSESGSGGEGEVGKREEREGLWERKQGGLLHWL